MSEQDGVIWLTIFGLAAASFAIRLSGFLLAQRLPRTGPWARGLEALPGCLIISLVALLMVQGGPVEWAGGAVALGVAFAFRSVPLSMIAGMAAVAILRALG
ncbi:Branched-chain amino acid transport protein (AzlD) [Pseudoruegeria aquimaris]|uniref:Branched-chain amino acid transport protein (AzlD) n=1 Tax=Pseudoruegeria aquimaris TaxID=393663 RepID=A0A1Y5RHG2_9RHOB|nr:AzlD domain-containing protein [Pseudoruegeria aquimaris]SLN17539.1 Branched-chain amino acid transport protein (AzlD) [Pseudoruegeria aquimaris]